MAWEALGADPVPGDPAAVVSAAGSLRTVAQRVGAVQHQLGALCSGIGPHMWSGVAAEAFTDSIRDFRPQAARLADAHAASSEALQAYAAALEDAQARARVAESDAEREQARYRRAVNDQQVAEADAASQTAVERQALARLAQARVLRLNPLADPAYLAELARWEHGVEAQRAAAARRAAEARARADAARRTAHGASLELARARGRAAEARRMRDEAAAVAVRRIRAEIPFDLLKTLKPWFDAAMGVVKFIDDASGDRWKKGLYPKTWQELLDRLGDRGAPLRYKRSEVLQWLADTYKKTPLHRFPKAEELARRLAENRVLKVISWGGTGYELYDGIQDVREHANANDRLGIVTDGMGMSGSVLKQGRTPITYLSGVVLTQYADVINHARQVDWSNLPSLDDWRKYGLESFGEAGVTTIKGIGKWFL